MVDGFERGFYNIRIEFGESLIYVRWTWVKA